MDRENQQILNAKSQNKTHTPQLLNNEDTVKQLLARSRYILYKLKEKWTPTQAEREQLLFEIYPDSKTAYILSQ